MKQNISVVILIIISILFHSCNNEILNEGEVKNILVEEFKVRDIESLEDKISSTINKQIEVITINPNNDTIVKLNNGIVLYLPNNMFDVNPNEGSIILKAVSIDSYLDMYSEDTECRTKEGDLIETAGMFNLIATNEVGEELKLKEGSKYIIHFPKNNNNDKMNLFYGNKNSEGRVQWDLDKQSLLASALGLVEGAYVFPIEDSIRRNEFINTEMNGTYKEYIRTKINYNDLNKFPTKGVTYQYEIDEYGKIFDFSFVGEVDDKWKNMLKVFFKAIPPLRPFNLKKGKTLVYETIGKITSAPKYMSNNEYKKSFRQKAQEYSDLGINSIKEAELKYYIFESNNIGWINCDRFLNDNEEFITYKFSKKAKVEMDSMELFFVFEDIKSFIAAEENLTEFYFENIPLNKKGQVIAIGYVNSEIFLGIETKVINLSLEEMPKLNSIKVSGFVERLKKLG